MLKGTVNKMRFIAAAFLIFLGGCSSLPMNGAKVKVTKVDHPPVGEVTTAYVGDYLLRKGEVVEEPVLQVRSPISGVMYKVPMGAYRQVGFDSKADFFSSAGVVQGPLSDPHKALKLDRAEGAELCVVTVYGALSCYKGDYEVANGISERGASFQQTLIYSGRVGDKIKFGYREFSNNQARPAFNNDVEYDLSVSRIIGYKGAELEVLSADNNSIKYRVIRTFR